MSFSLYAGWQEIQKPDESIYKSHVDVGTQKDPHGNGCKDKTQARPARKSQANKKPILKNIQRFARHGKHRKHNGPYKVRHLGFAVKGNDEKQWTVESPKGGWVKFPRFAIILLMNAATKWGISNFWFKPTWWINRTMEINDIPSNA